MVDFRWIPKREARPTDQEIIMRLVDRILRPMPSIMPMCKL